MGPLAGLNVSTYATSNVEKFMASKNKDPIDQMGSMIINHHNHHSIIEIIYNSSKVKTYPGQLKKQTKRLRFR
jgi:hypothetical protein